MSAARELFCESGYAEASLDEIADRAGVTKGSLYHHFSGKVELFEAVFENEARRLTELAAAAISRTEDPWQAVYAGLTAFLDGAQDPAVQRILLQDAPSVLGWERTREIDRSYGLAAMQAAVAGLASAGEIAVPEVETMAHLLFGMLIEATLLLHSEHGAPAARKKIEAGIRTVLEGLAGPNRTAGAATR